ncbi:MAG TPA: ABC transporter substrate-binding protein [Thermomicrobiales bacterium]|nr:ABC transporter substrate-binding protein [Thermomicrobiales bacterium]
MADSSLRAALEALVAGRLSRRAFIARATALGLTPALARTLALDPAVALAAPVTVSATPAAGPGKGAIGPASDILSYASFNVDQAPLEIQAGKMDLYLYGLKTAGAKDLAANPKGVSLIETPASTLSLILNPAPPRQGELNPFAIKEIRQAMQFLVDRDFIANNIYQGRARPMYCSVSPLDYDELTVFDTLRQSGIRYDAEFAKGVITDQMKKAGATLSGNVWMFQGRPVLVKIVTRVEDERRDIGDLVRAALANLGFQAQPIYQPFGPATLAVYASDPITFQWHIYTEGWSRSAPDRYDFGTINQMYAPWLGNMPGWLETGFWQYQQPDLDKLGQRLYKGQFKNRQERDDLYRQMTALGIAESVRIWLATALQSFPVRDAVQNLNIDIVAGPKSPLSLRTASVEGAKQLRAGHVWVWTDRTTWNPVGGLTDVYSADIHQNLVDAPVLNHPFSGLPIPFRTAYTVETAGPDGTLDVPADAVLWDAKGDAWKPVGNGVKAVSKVTYDYSKYFGAPFHHGQKIAPADFLYSISQSWEIAYDDKKIQIETALGITSRPLLQTFKGIKLLPDNKVETYVDFWHFEPSYIASYATAGSVATPWELLYAMDDIVFNQRRGAYSDTAAARFNVPWLSLVTDTDARSVQRTLRQFIAQKSVPKGVFVLNGKTLVSADDAVARYNAASKWFDQTKLLVISNGPFFLAKYDPPAQYAELHAFRAEGYPFTADDWRFGPPPTLAITAQPPATLKTGAPISLPVTVKGPGTLALRYALVDPAASDPTKSIVASADVNGEKGSFTIDIGSDVTSKLFPSVYQLYLLASSDQMAQVAEQRLDLQVGV